MHKRGGAKGVEARTHSATFLHTAISLLCESRKAARAVPALWARRRARGTMIAKRGNPLSANTLSLVMLPQSALWRFLLPTLDFRMGKSVVWLSEY